MKLRKEIVAMIRSKFALLTAAIAIIAAVTCLGAASGRIAANIAKLPGLLTARWLQ
jgi:hypothetical protein